MSFAKKTAGLFFGRVGTAGLMFVGRALAARVLGPSLMGVFSASTTALAVTSRVLSLGLGPSAQYRAAVHRRSPRNAFPALFTSALLVSILSLAVVALFRPHLETLFFSNSEIGRQVFGEFLPYLPALFFSLTMLMALLGCGAIALYNVASVVPGAALCIFAGWALLNDPSDWQIVLLGQKVTWVAGAVLGTGFAYAVFREYGPAKWDLRGLFSYGLRAAVVSSLSLALDRGALLAGNHFVDTHQLGLYAVAATMAESLNLVYGTISSLIVTRLSGENRERSAELTARVSRLSLIFALGSGILLAGLSFVIIPIFFGGAYRASAPILCILLPGFTCMMLQNLSEGYWYARNRPQLSIVANLPVAAVLVIALYYLGPRWGGLGLGVATSLANLAGALTSVYLVRRISGIPMRRFLTVGAADFADLIRLSRSLLRPPIGDAAARKFDP